MTTKLKLFKEYISIQAEDEALWFEARHITEAILQKELRKVAFLIEEATEQQIKKEIFLYKARLYE